MSARAHVPPCGYKVLLLACATRMLSKCGPIMNIEVQWDIKLHLTIYWSLGGGVGGLSNFLFCGFILTSRSCGAMNRLLFI